MNKIRVGCGALAALLAILLDAYAEHGLRSQVTAETLAHLSIATRYQFMHALALVVVGFRPGVGGRWITAACGCWVMGMLLFGGGMYASHLLAVDGARPLIPLGGLAYMIGWLCLVVAATIGE
jgi:uncharacterized membrane protein YgdD (TMEM256/DUF423 family)